MAARAASAVPCWLCGWQVSEAAVIRVQRDDQRPTCADCARIRYGPTPLPRKPRPGRDDVARMIVDAITKEADNLPPDIHNFLEVLVRRAPDLGTVRKLAQAFDSKPSSLQSRFARAGLPSLKDYLSMVRLVYASWYFEDQAATCGMVAYRLDYSSPQSLGRHLRARLGIQVSAFRRMGFQPMLERFITSLIRPFRERLSTFQPLRKRISRPCAPVAA